MQGNTTGNVGGELLSLIHDSLGNSNQTCIKKEF